MTTKPNANKKPGAKPGVKPGAGGPSESGKAKASAGSVKKMKPADAAASGKRSAPGAKPAAPAGPAKPAAKPAAKTPAASGPAPTPSGRAGRPSKRGSARDLGLRTNLSADIAGLDKVVQREKQREEFAKMQASGASIKTTDRGAREARKVFLLLGVVGLGVVGLFGFILFRGWFMPPSQEELVEVNTWCEAKMAVALKKVSAPQIQKEFGNRELTDDEKRRLLRNKLLEQIAVLEAKNEKAIEAVNDSAASKSREELIQDQRALVILKTLKDAYGRDWLIEFDHDYVILKSLGGNNQDDSGPGAHEAKLRSDDVVISVNLPFHRPKPVEVPLASTDVPIAPVIDLAAQASGRGNGGTIENSDAPTPPRPRSRPEEIENPVQQDPTKNPFENR